MTLTYLLHRPCIYCSALLIILFISSCHWSDRCFFDFQGDWFSPRFTSDSSPGMLGTNQSLAASDGDESLVKYFLDTMNTTATTLAEAAVEQARKRMDFASRGTEEWTGIGLEWLRSLLGRHEWTVPCLDVKVRL